MDLLERPPLDDAEVERLKNLMRTGRLKADIVELVAQLGYAPALRLFPRKAKIRSAYWDDAVNFEKALTALPLQQRRVMIYACGKRLLPLLRWLPVASDERLRAAFQNKGDGGAMFAMAVERAAATHFYGDEIDSVRFAPARECFADCLRGMARNEDAWIFARGALRSARAIWSGVKPEEIEPWHDERQVQVDSFAKFLLGDSTTEGKA